MLLYPRRRMGLIHVSKTLLKMPWSSSGSWWFLSTSDSGRLVQHSSAKSTEYTKKRTKIRRDVCEYSATVEGRVKYAMSQNKDARRYSVARSEGLRDRRCSRIRSRLRPKVAIMEANNESKKSVFCSTSTLKTLAQYEDSMVESNNPRA